MKFSSKVPLNIHSGTNIAAYLAKRFTYQSIEEWKNNLAEGCVSMNNIRASVNDTVVPGSIIEYDPGEFEEPPANLNYSIIYEDEWFVGIAKPGNLLVHRAGKSFRNNLIYQLRYVHSPQYKEAHTTHRLDRDTSGVVLVAKTSEARAAIGLQFSSGDIHKEYIAVVHGVPDNAVQQISLPIGKSVESAISYKFQVDPQGKEAITNVISVEKIGSKFAMVTLQPLTGRTHQIRIHLCAIGHPIVGDKLYGLSEKEYLSWRDNPLNTSETQLFYRHALHCKALVFKHPYTQKICRIEACLPEDMYELIGKLKEE